MESDYIDADLDLFLQVGTLDLSNLDADDDDDANDSDMGEPIFDFDAVTKGLEQQVKDKEDRERKQNSRAQPLRREASTMRTPAKKEVPSLSTLPPSRVRLSPPGLSLFDTDSFLGVYDYESLDLEKDFNYRSKSKLESLGFERADIKKLMFDPWRLLTVLTPTASSALLGDVQDFSSVCDYLFFVGSSCADDDCLREACATAIFELLVNYNYKWSLSVEHIWTALRNLGLHEDCLNCTDHFQFIFQSRISVLRKRSRAYKFVAPRYRSFFTIRLDESAVRRAKKAAHDDHNDEASQTKLLKWLIGFVSDYLVTFGSTHDSKFRVTPQTVDWTPHLYVVYLLSILSTERRVLLDAETWSHISLAYNAIFNSFTKDQWVGEKDSRDMNTAVADISEVIAQCVQRKGLTDIATWSLSWLPDLPQFRREGLDHHHNLVHRLLALPPTYRGGQVRKNVALLNLQQLIDPEEYVGETMVSTRSVLQLIEENKKKFRELHANRYVMMNVIRLIDCIVGGEISDFQDEMYEHLDRVKEHLDGFKRWPSMNCEHDSAEGVEVTMVRELFEQVLTKWGMLRNRNQAITAIVN